MITKNTTILISGASIAGPALAYWLKRFGFTPTVIERAPQLREGGYPIDVRDEAVQVAKRMGIWPRLQQEQTKLGELWFMNERNQRLSGVNIQAPLTAEQGKGLWEWFPGVLSKACCSEIGAEKNAMLEPSTQRGIRRALLGGIDARLLPRTPVLRVGSPAG